ncbi:MAG: phosphate ABC transporter permease PstA [Candidatus Omnitrophica bacterium]|nr:phosphate ABC transporter permease PstA [Candidatus Omnitrophota bacterium]
MRPEISQKIGFSLFKLSLFITLFFLGTILWFIAIRGYRVISWEFLTTGPREAMTEGGVAPAIIGTFYLVLGSLIISGPLGVGCAIYLCEYNPPGPIANIIKASINNLAGVPSVVFGLFGLGVFVKFFKFGVSLLSGSLTLGILSLPLVISSCQEALLAVPHSWREASLALGASRLETIKRVVLPAAFPGILTGFILSVGRVAGETAPIMFTAATFYMRGYPNSIFSEVMALPYHLYALMTEGIYPEKQVPIAYGCALVLLIVVLSISTVAIILRHRYRIAHGE